MRTKPTVAAVAAALVLAFPAPRVASEMPAATEAGPARAPTPEAFSASVPAGMAAPGQFFPFAFVVDRWTSREEGLTLAALQSEKGIDAAIARLAASPAGRVRAPDRWPQEYGSGEIYAASVLPSPLGGRAVRLLTRMHFVLRDGGWKEGAQRHGDQLGLLQLELDEKGEGLGGTLIPANVIPLDADGRLTFDPTPFPKETYELVGVRAFDGK
jgi:hypothetical protein